MNPKVRKIRSVENKFLSLYSTWQETRGGELADEWMRLLGELLRLNPKYSIRHPFERAF